MTNVLTFEQVITIFSDLAKWIHANEPGTLVYQVNRSLSPGKDGNEDVVLVERSVAAKGRCLRPLTQNGEDTRMQLP